LDNKRVHVEYYNGNKDWHDLGSEEILIVYPVGTQVYKQFPYHGFYWGEIIVCKHTKDGLYYEVEYSNGDLERITDEPDSVQLLQELLHSTSRTVRESPKRHEPRRRLSLDSPRTTKLVDDLRVSYANIATAVRETLHIRHQRRTTVNNLRNYDRWEETVENVSRSVKQRLRFGSQHSSYVVAGTIKKFKMGRTMPLYVPR
jgi:hypothetical protein